MASYWTVPVRVDMQWFEEHVTRHVHGEAELDSSLPDDFAASVWTAFRAAVTPMLCDAATAAIGKGADGTDTRLPGCKRGSK